VTIDKSGSNVAALDAIYAGRGKPIVLRQIKHPNNIVEQDHRCARLQESSQRPHSSLRHRTHAHDQKEQMKHGGKGQSPARHFYSLAA
jgi:putative transposase